MIKQQIKCAPLCISRPQGHIFILKLIGRQLYVKLELNHEPISCHVIFCIKIFISSPPTPCPNLIIPLSQTQTQTTQFSHEKTCKLIWKNCANRILNITIPKIEFAHLFDLFNFQSDTVTFVMAKRKGQVQVDSDSDGSGSSSASDSVS